MNKRLACAYLWTLCTVMSLDLSAQRQKMTAPYRTAIGAITDAGPNENFVGISAKQRFGKHSAVEADLQFGKGLLSAKAFYLHQQQFTAACPLEWYLGGGPVMYFGDIDVAFALSPVAGLDFVIPKTRLDIFSDWRPQLFVDRDSEWESIRFAFGLRYSW